MKYLRVTVNGVRKLAHVAAWEKENGPIPKGYVVHHINGDKTDNRLENLTIMTRSEHTKMHTILYFQKIENRIRQIETQRRVHNTTEMVAKHSEASKKKWLDPEYQERRRISLIGIQRSAAARDRIKEAFSNPIVRSHFSEAQKRRWANMPPEEYERARERLRESAFARWRKQNHL